MSENKVEVVLTGQDVSASAVIKNFEGNLRSFNTALSAFTGGLVGGFGFGAIAGTLRELGAAAKETFQGFIDQTEQLQNLSNQTSLAIPQIEALRRVMTEHGLSADAATRAFIHLNDALATNNPILKAIAPTARDASDAFMQAVKFLSQLDDQALATKISTELLGGRAKELVGSYQMLNRELPGTIAYYDLLESKLKTARVASAEIKEAENQLSRAFDEQKEKLEGNIALFINYEIQLGKTSMTWSEYIAKLKAASAEANAEGTKAQSAAMEEFKKQVAATAEEIRKLIDAQNKIGGGATIEERLRGIAGEGHGRMSPVDEGIDVADSRIVKSPVFMGPLTREQVMDNWKKLHEGLMTVIDGIGFGLQSGFATAFDGILRGTMTLGEAIRATFQSVISGIIQALAALAATAIVKWVIGFFAFGPLGALGGGALGAGGVVVDAARPPVGALPSGNTFVIQTFAPKDVVGQLVSPWGSLRRASDRVQIGKGY